LKVARNTKKTENKTNEEKRRGPTIGRKSGKCKKVKLFLCFN
jgi:hypothetical protein